MSNISEPNSEHVDRQPHLKLIEGGFEVGVESTLFSHDWGSPLDMDTMLASVRTTETPGGVVQVVLNRVLPSDLAENNHVQEFVHQMIAAAEDYYTTKIWPTYPRGSADLDQIIELFEATEPYENCTLLHTLRSLSEEDPHGAEKYKDAERIAQLLVLNEAV